MFLFRSVQLARAKRLESLWDGAPWPRPGSVEASKKRALKKSGKRAKPGNGSDPGHDGIAGPFYAVRIGPGGFRGVMLRNAEYQALLSVVVPARGKKIVELSEAQEYYRGGDRRGIPPNFFAFRYGKDGARGVVVGPRHLRHIQKRVSSPSFQVEEFDNATQAMIYCQQAGTPLEDWKDVCDSLKYLANNPSLYIPNLWADFLVQKTLTGLLPRGPLVPPDLSMDPACPSGELPGFMDPMSANAKAFWCSPPLPPLYYPKVNKLGMVLDETRLDLDAQKRGPFYAIRCGRGWFRGVVLKKEDYKELLRGAKVAKGRKEETLTEALAFCRRRKPRGSLTFHAFRYGKNGARGIVLAPDTLEKIERRVGSPFFQTQRFQTATQAIIFCQQAGTSSVDWRKPGRAIRYLADNPSLDVPSLWSDFLVKSWRRPTLSCGPLPVHRTAPPVRAHPPDSHVEQQTNVAVAADAESMEEGQPLAQAPLPGTVDENRATARLTDVEARDFAEKLMPLKGPFYVIRRGQGSFRGVVLRKDEFRDIMGGQRASIGRRIDSFLDALAECRNPKGGCHLFFAFRYGKDGARGLVKTRENLEIVLEQVYSPSVQKRVFPTATQALVFCEQAGTKYKDWKRLGRSVRFFVQNPHLRTPTLWSRYFIRRPGRSLVMTAIPILSPASSKGTQPKSCLSSRAVACAEPSFT
ncbi:hypothetical protein FVE85_3592 [Porphyridium purpureum]|uniref:Uncharacterized protein n=1 Tax=Porphyridium purpureum TaxID=35688 RepID=A0A5J4YN75_PORPP|nr:hypothetical protein FVE85_3592 [Porphyridium purpureum]|eukprot:POR7106..scf249_10